MKDRGAALLERSTNPILMIRLSDGLVVETNEALFMMTGFNRRELLGRSAQELVIPVRPPSPAVALHVLDSLGSVADIPAGFRTRSGELRVAHLSAQAIEIDGQLEALCTIRDSRDPTSAERRAAAGEEVARILTGTASPEPARAALQAIGECLRWDLGALWHVDPLTEQLSCEAAWRWPLADLAALEKSRWRGTVSPGNGLPARVWKASQATWITDLAEEGGAGQGAAGDEGTDHESVHGWFGFPVVAGDEVVGVVEFFSREARQLDSELVQMATRLGRLFGRLLGGAVQEQQVEQEQGSGQEGAAEQDWSLDAAANAPPNADQLLLRELVARVARVNEMLEAIVGPDPTDPETTAPPAVATGERTAAPRSRSGRALTLKVLSELTGVPPGRCGPGNGDTDSPIPAARRPATASTAKRMSRGSSRSNNCGRGVYASGRRYRSSRNRSATSCRRTLRPSAIQPLHRQQNRGHIGRPDIHVTQRHRLGRNGRCSDDLAFPLVRALLVGATV